MVPIIADPELNDLLRRELRNGEKLIWADQPRASAFRRSSIGIVIFGIPWTAFALFWMGGAWWMSGPNEAGPAKFFPLFGIPFVLVGFGMLSSPLWMGRKAKRTLYAITDQRAITIEPVVFRGTKVQTFLPERLTSMARIERKDGSGDLIFEEFTTRAGSGTQTTRRGFFGIENVREVEDLITSTLLRNRTRPTIE